MREGFGPRLARAGQRGLGLGRPSCAVPGPNPCESSCWFAMFSLHFAMWQIDINVVTFDTFETPVESVAHNF